MEHGHEHHHHEIPSGKINTAFYVGIGLNLLFVITEVLVGLYVHSLSLLSDAGHNLADVAGLALSLLAFALVKVKPNENYTYGYKKTTILIALFNALVLLVSVIIICYEAIRRFRNPEPLPGFVIAAVAAVGIVINAVSALFFFRNKEKDINIKAAYLHLMSDALVSLALVIGGIVIYYTGWRWIDPALSIVVAIVILFSTKSLLAHSLRLAMDGVPENISPQSIKELVETHAGVKEANHIHIWSISSTQNALTMHIKVDAALSLKEIEAIKQDINHTLLHENIHHTTIETEPDTAFSKNMKC
jgi:cobalt-zinc-cadmium efflux system protein